VSLILDDAWIWDFWVARDGPTWHLFFLRAPRSLDDPDLRHRHAVIGHARSADLRTWEVLGDVVVPGGEGAWDDLATWTGSVVRAGDTWWMFYTGVSTVDGGKVQRIGVATSTDLDRWEKSRANPLLETDARWYETYDPSRWYEEAWRDPWVFRDPDGDGYHMFLTARSLSVPAASAGVIGHARSPDLVHWMAQPPLVTPGDFGHLEVPQYVFLDGKHYLLFSVTGDMQPDAHSGRAVTGVGYFVADAFGGPYREGPTPFISADGVGRLYAGKIILDGGQPVFLATLAHSGDGRYLGGISDPMPVRVGRDGRLMLTAGA